MTAATLTRARRRQLGWLHHTIHVCELAGDRERADRLSRAAWRLERSEQR